MLIRKIFISILFLLLCSCSFDFNNFKNKIFPKKEEGEPEIRIVDINGNYRAIKKQVPILNSKLIQQQQQQLNTSTQNINQNSESTRIVTQEEIDNFHQDLGRSTEPLAQNPNNLKEEQVEYDLGQEEKIEEPREIQKIYKTPTEKSSKGIFVQIGSFVSKSGANDVLNKGKKFSDGFVKEVKGKNRTINKVLLGPTENKNSARILLKKARNNGFKDAFITKIK